MVRTIPIVYTSEVTLCIYVCACIHCTMPINPGRETVDSEEDIASWKTDATDTSIANRLNR